VVARRRVGDGALGDEGQVAIEGQHHVAAGAAAGVGGAVDEQLAAERIAHPLHRR
jgi:hypothetical protein